MSLNKIPSWFIVGIMIYPLLIFVGLIFSLATSGDFNFMYWLYIPSLMFQELFKKCCENIASNNKLILLSGFIFWFLIGAVLGLIVKTIKCSQVISQEEIKVEEKRDEELNKPKEEVKTQVSEEVKPEVVEKEKTEEQKEEKTEEVQPEQSKVKEEILKEIKEEPNEKIKLEEKKEKPKESKATKKEKQKKILKKK